MIYSCLKDILIMFHDNVFVHDFHVSHYTVSLSLVRHYVCALFTCANTHSACFRWGLIFTISRDMCPWVRFWWGLLTHFWWVDGNYDVRVDVRRRFRWRDSRCNLWMDYFRWTFSVYEACHEFSFSQFTPWTFFKYKVAKKVRTKCRVWVNCSFFCSFAS